MRLDWVPLVGRWTSVPCELGQEFCRRFVAPLQIIIKPLFLAFSPIASSLPRFLRSNRQCHRQR